MGTGSIIRSTWLKEAKIERRPGLAADWTAGVAFNIFTVNGDAILVHNIFGIVTTLMGVGAAVPRFAFTPTGGALVNMSAAMATIAGDVAGSIYVWDGITATVPAPAAQIGWADSAEFGWNGDPGVLPTGIISIVNAVACNAGIVDWYVVYTPCSNASQVTPL